SRRIGLTNDGQQVPIYGGIRLIGRMKTWDIGIMDMQTKSLDRLPSENFGVLRIRKRVFNQNSFVGGMFTNRIDADGNYNTAYGIDGLVRILGDDYLTVQWAQTFDSRTKNVSAQNFESGRLALELNRRRRAGFGYTLGAVLSGPNYNPGLGFVDRNDFKLGTAALSQTWLKEDGVFIWHKLELLGNTYFSNTEHEVLSSEIGSEWSFSTRNLDSGGIMVKRVYENLLEEFVLSDEVKIPIGAYHFYRVIGSYRMSVDNTVRTSMVMETGPFYDGWLNSVTVTPTWYLSKHFQLSLAYAFNRAKFDDRDAVFNSHITRLSIGTALNRKVSTNALVQFNSAVDLFSANVRFRYNFREGQDLWVVFNTGLNTNRPNLQPLLPVVDTQSVLVKYIHTFIF
ncbi:MAG: hypothetical protein KAJ23_16985, partial [Maribacter sp.]|nr:hypothetical protein [Maribacter sp.]